MLTSDILAGSPRLEEAASGGPSVKKKPLADDPDAVRRIQKALVALGFPLPISFAAGPSGEPDGIFGQETYQAVLAFQKREFPKEPGQWDGRVGKNTLARMDKLLGPSTGDSTTLPPNDPAVSRCVMRVPPTVA
jgi:peptidoglycan hydrolase-like protein with peptidoglycan-binding domain